MYWLLLALASGHALRESQQAEIGTEMQGSFSFNIRNEARCHLIFFPVAFLSTL